MQYLVKEKIKIDRPLVFLCGPYYEEKPYDRRKIMKDFFINDHDIHALPVVVDNFLSKEKINDNTINIPLMEEICAAVSAKTYIFLDTFSAVAELGMFSTSTYSNKICVIMPHKTDKLIENINFFVEEICEAGKNIEYVEYRPKITRVPIASDYVVEYYEFPYNKIPENIKINIIDDDCIKPKQYSVQVAEDSRKPDGLNINYSKHSKVNSYTIYLNFQMLFYLVASIIIENETDDVNYIYEVLKETISNTIYRYNSTKPIIHDFNIGLNYSIDELIIHIIKFISLYNTSSQAKGYKIITKENSLLIRSTPFESMELDEEDIKLMDEYIKNPLEYVEPYKLKTKRKIRHIVKYNNNDAGKKIRNLHNKLLEMLTLNYEYNSNSYAYRKGYSIFDCVKQHVDSTSFLVLDIKSFFNSITYNLMQKALGDSLFNECSKKIQIDLIVRCLLYENSIPLGYVTSPLLSDIIMKDFDTSINQILSSHYPSIIYTRYADDMIFSSKNTISSDEKDKILDIASMLLHKKKLRINDKKTRLLCLKNQGDHVKLLGLNIIKDNNNNIITVGKKYIYDTAKLYLKYLEELNSEILSDEDKFYGEKIISGRIAYIKQIEGDFGYRILKDRIAKSTKGRVVIPDGKIVFKK